MRIPHKQMQQEFARVLRHKGMTAERASLCAEIFAENSLVGVASHGLNRFPGFVEFIEQGHVDLHAEAECVTSLGALEQWDGRLGPGTLNAHTCTKRAMALAQQHGIGCVGLRNTNHWMRGGYYGWMAAEAGFALISWTNTKPNVPPWGAVDCRVGNNPLVFAAPKADGPVVLDMAMSQFSFGRMEGAERAGEELPLAGGFDGEGNLTQDPGAILEANRALPIGYWKGSGLALLLDLVGTLVSGGLSTHQIGQQETEYGVSQLFIALDVGQTNTLPAVHRLVEQVIADLHSAEVVEGGGAVLYPGERALRVRQENLERGIPVEPAIWAQVLEMGRG